MGVFILLLILLVLALYWGATVGVVWLVCGLCGWHFSVTDATMVWCLFNAALGVIKVVKSHDH